MMKDLSPTKIIILIFVIVVAIIGAVSFASVKASNEVSDSNAEFIAAVPNYRVLGLSDPDQIDGVPDAFVMIALNASVLGSSGDTEIKGLSLESQQLMNLVPSASAFSWRVGVIGFAGNPAAGSFTVFVDRLDDIDAYRSHLYLGLTDSEVEMVEREDYLHFERPANDVTVRKLIQIRSFLEYPVPQEELGSLYGKSAAIGMDAKSGHLTLTLDSQADRTSLDSALRKYIDFIDIIQVDDFLIEAAVLPAEEKSLITAPILYDPLPTKENCAAFWNGTLKYSENFAKCDGLTPANIEDLFGAGSRLNDTPPHWAGARITNDVTNCTSGPTLRGLTSQNLYGSTAAHCGDQGSMFYSYNVPYVFGSVAGKSNFPTYDTVRLAGATYAQYIHTSGSPGAETVATREVVGGGGMTVGNTYCVSGAISLANCTALLIQQNVSATIYYAGYGYGYTHHLAVFGNGSDEGPLVQSGDSGGPVYTRNTANNRANFKGWVTAGMGIHVLYASMYVPNAEYLNSEVYYTHTSE